MHMVCILVGCGTRHTPLLHYTTRRCATLFNVVRQESRSTGTPRGLVCVVWKNMMLVSIGLRYGFGWWCPVFCVALVFLVGFRQVVVCWVMQYRKRPLVVDAVRCDDVLRAMRMTSSSTAPKTRIVGVHTVSISILPDWVSVAYAKKDLLVLLDAVEIRTLEGWMTAGRDDWIIRGVEGEIYPCKASVFNATYEPA